MAVRVQPRPLIIASVVFIMYVVGFWLLPEGAYKVGPYLPVGLFFAIGYGGNEVLAYVFLVIAAVALWSFIYFLFASGKRT